MTKEKLKSVFQHYRDHLEQAYPDLPTRQMTGDQTQLYEADLSTTVVVSHLKFMCEEAQRFVDQDRVEKAMRWLGFLQGVLWKEEVFTLDDLKKQSMPSDAI